MAVTVVAICFARGARAGAGRTASKSGDVHDLPVQLGEGAKAPSTARGPGSGTAALTGETAVRSGEDLKILYPNGVVTSRLPSVSRGRVSAQARSTRRWASAARRAFIVPPGTRGLSMGQEFRKHSIPASHTAEVVLDDVRVPGRCLVGGKEKPDRRLTRGRRDGRRRRPAAARRQRLHPRVPGGAVAPGHERSSRSSMV
jgi:alkylation response protein AidB-like acyl-CoA dehydrogenase